MKATKLFLLAKFLLLVFGRSEAHAFYNPQTGRWLSRDPKEDRSGIDYAFKSNDLLINVDKLGLEVTELFNQTLLTPNRMAETDFPSLALQPAGGGCGFLWSKGKFTTTLITYPEIIRYAPGNLPDDPNPHAPPATLRDHEMVHIQHLRDYLTSINREYLLINPFKCVCRPCYAAKSLFILDASIYHMAVMNAKTYRFDCDQYEGDACLRAEIEEELLPGLLENKNVAFGVMNTACRGTW